MVIVTSTAGRRAETFAELQDLITLCKQGNLFEVQAWIESGKPVNPPPYPGNGNRKKSPLEYALDTGFHSLVEVLLQGGAALTPEGTFDPMRWALEKRRLDLVQLLVEYGYDPSQVNMVEAFSSWEPQIMEFLIERGADVETEMPLALALCNRIRTAIRICKKYRERFPSFQEQLNVALRHHCREGNLKWVSLLLWAGGDPLAPGEADPNTPVEPEDGGLSALGFAALHKHYDVFRLSQVKLPLDHPAMRDVLLYSCDSDGLELVEQLLSRGMNPNDQENGGCSAIQHTLTHLGWFGGRNEYPWESRASGSDTRRTRTFIKAIHLLAKHGGRWVPKEKYDITSVRSSLLKMTPDYTLEFAWIMSKYGACSRQDIVSLVGTPTIKRHLAQQRERLADLLAGWRPDSDPDSALTG